MKNTFITLKNTLTILGLAEGPVCNYFFSLHRDKIKNAENCHDNLYLETILGNKTISYGFLRKKNILFSHHSTVYSRYSNSLNSGNSCISIKSWMTNLYFYLINPIWIVENLAIVDNLRLTKLSTISRVHCIFSPILQVLYIPYVRNH